jgi:hypothetical protein
MIKFSQGFAATGVYEEGYSPTVVNWLLIGSAAAVAFGGCYTVYQSVAKNLYADIKTFEKTISRKASSVTARNKHDATGEEGGEEQEQDHEEDEEEEEMEQSSNAREDKQMTPEGQYDKPRQDIEAIETNKIMI